MLDILLHLDHRQRMAEALVLDNSVWLTGWSLLKIR